MATIEAKRVVVVLPNWLGDAVMATPVLRALRAVYPEAHIAVMARELTAPVVEGLGTEMGVDEIFVQKKGHENRGVEFLREGKFDLGVLLPNSFRAAWMLWRGGVRRRLGYRREWRGLLLTDSLEAEKRTRAQRMLDEKKAAAIEELGGPRVRVGSKYQPGPVIDYYNRLAAYLGANGISREMALGITDEERVEAERATAAFGGRRFVLLVPGANFGSSKCWPAEYFAKLADRLMESHDVCVAIASSPAEIAMVEAIVAGSAHQERVVLLAKLNEGRGVTLGALKEIVRRAEVVVCNDTGPRHFAVALNKPVVTLFGPTDPRWAAVFYDKERQVSFAVPCGPCQLKKCPIDHRCMKGITVDRVLEAVNESWNGTTSHATIATTITDGRL